MDERREQSWHAMTVDGVLAHLKSDTEGLTSADVRTRREYVGTN